MPILIQQIASENKLTANQQQQKFKKIEKQIQIKSVYNSQFEMDWAEEERFAARIRCLSLRLHRENADSHV